MSLTALRTLVAVADTGTFSAAAGRLNITHAAVSQRIRTLEDGWQVSLFDRSGRSPRFTPLGQAVLERARDIVSAYDRLLPEVLGDGGLGGTLRVGALATHMSGLVAATLAALKEAAPDLRVQVHPALTPALTEMVERGHLDAAIVPHPHSLGDGIDWQEIAREPFGLIASLQETCGDAWELLRSRPFIRIARAGLAGAMIETWLQDRGLDVNDAMELEGTEAVASMVYCNLGVAIVPRLAVSNPHEPPLRHLTLGDDAPIRRLGLISRADAPRAVALAVMADALRTAIARGRVPAPGQHPGAD